MVRPPNRQPMLATFSLPGLAAQGLLHVSLVADCSFELPEIEGPRFAARSHPFMHSRFALSRASAMPVKVNLIVWRSLSNLFNNLLRYVSSSLRARGRYDFATRIAYSHMLPAF